MALLILLRLFFALRKRRVALLLGALSFWVHKLLRSPAQPPRVNRASRLMAAS